MSARACRTAVAVLAAAGAAVSAYLTISKLGHTQVVCPTSGCEIVQHSSYSKLFGVPVAAFGLVGFLAIGATALLRDRRAAAVGGALAVAGATFAVYLVVIQLAVIEAVCVWCATSDVTAVLLAVAALWRVAALEGTAQSLSESAPPRRGDSPKRRAARTTIRTP